MIVLQKKTGKVLGTCRDVACCGHHYLRSYAVEAWPYIGSGWPRFTDMRYRFRFIDWAWRNKVALIAHGLRDAMLLPEFIATNAHT